MNKIITIGREFGSGGREFGRRLAEELGIEYYDKEIITAIAEKTSMSQEYVQEVLEGKPHTLYPITIGQSMLIADNLYIQQEQSIYLAQSEIIRELAQKSSCVIVGRCADFILRDLKPYRIFIYADMESRIKRCISRNTDSKKQLTEKEIKKQIIRIDKNRAKYYDYYTGNNWGDKNNYDLCINTTDLVIKDIVPIIAKML
ncbi:MAG: cytidylate kinase-like family protein [Clostridia bacterium]|nr:cytidylate kinase-like family protein [Clostridia bacterium]